MNERTASGNLHDTVSQACKALATLKSCSRPTTRGQQGRCKGHANRRITSAVAHHRLETPEKLFVRQYPSSYLLGFSGV